MVAFLEPRIELWMPHDVRKYPAENPDRDLLRMLHLGSESWNATRRRCVRWPYDQLFRQSRPGCWSPESEEAQLSPKIARTAARRTLLSLISELLLVSILNPIGPCVLIEVAICWSTCVMLGMLVRSSYIMLYSWPMPNGFPYSLNACRNAPAMQKGLPYAKIVSLLYRTYLL